MLDNLNKEQIDAVICTEGPLLVLAGAGSGKTRVITRRIAYLVKEKGVSPYNILAITFTNKAAKEMKQRVDELLAGRTEGMIISTFHSACVRILRRQITKLGFSSNFNIYDTQDSLSLIKTVIKDLELSDSQFNPKSMLSHFGSLKDEMIGPEEYTDSHASNFYEKNIGRIYTEYQKRLKKNNALDFDDIISHTVKIFQNHGDVLAYYQDRFRYILVDEYQDTNKLQFVLIDLLSGRYRNLCVVGDDDQSIFMWRGADIRNILSFEKNFRGTNVIKLEQNYRSTQTILAAANDVIRHNEGRKEKKLWTEKKEGDKIRINRSENEYHESRFIVNEIRSLVEQGVYEYNDFAILYRMNAQSRSVEDAFLASGVPYKVFGSMEFYKRKEVKDVLSYLKLIYNEFDSVSFERAVSVPKRGIGNSSLVKIRTEAESKDISMLKVAESPDPGQFGAAQKKNLEGFAAFINDMRMKAETMKPSLLIGEVIENTGIIDEYMKAEPFEYETRVENIRELISIAIQYEKDGITTLAELLETVSLVSDVETTEGSERYVSLMTLHSAKGLEFPVVFICGFEEGIFPSERSALEQKLLEEERRLCYVGITRAMELLYLTCTKNRTIFGKTRYAMISRFFSDIDPGLYEYDEGSGTDRMHVFVPLENKNKGTDYQPGERVLHKRFGRGTVLNITKDGDDNILEIDFEGKGKRRLMEEYANLEKM